MSDLRISNDFSPPRWLRDPHLQSVLASFRPLRRWWVPGERSLGARTSELLIETDEGVRLQAFHSAVDGVEGGSRGLALLLHGWEGSARSAYLVATARELTDRGWDVVRLNFRDHGDTHHLNPGLFHSCLLPEALDAARQIAAGWPARPLAVVGFSLGGNFALRLGLRADERLPISHVVAVNPAIHPPHILDAMENGPAHYERYFLKRWRRSLELKRRAWPDLYRIDWQRLGGLRETTRWMIEHLSEFDDIDAYFDGYSIANDRLASLDVPATIVTSADDPIIPVEDFFSLQLPAHATLDVQRWGGHCGYVETLGGRNWARRRVVETLERVAGGAAERGSGRRGEAEASATVAPGEA